MHPNFMRSGMTRRSALLGLGAAFSLGRASMALAAAPTDSRFVVIIMRGALDGMAAVVPYGDPALASLAPGPDPRRRRHRRRHGRSWRLLRPEPRHAAIRRAVPCRRVAARPRRRRSLPQPQPFRGTGLHGERRRPAHDQRLAQPCRAGDGQAPRPRGCAGRGHDHAAFDARAGGCWGLGTAQFRRARSRFVRPHRRPQCWRRDYGPGHHRGPAGSRLLRRHLGWDGEAGQRLCLSRPRRHGRTLAGRPDRPPGRCARAGRVGTRMPTRCAASPGRWGSWIRVWRR